MSTSIKAIETRYKGYRFRSRLEARWAVFFDALDIRWEYEPEGFDLGKAGWYLPDFLLPEWDCWIEVKSRLPSSDESRKFVALSAKWKHEGSDPSPHYKAAYMLCGTPGTTEIKPTRNGTGWALVGGYMALRYVPEMPTTVHVFAECGGGSHLDIWPIYYSTPNVPVFAAAADEFKELGQLVIGLTFNPNRFLPRVYCGDGVTYDTSSIKAAYSTARAARFEHGETP